MKGCELSAGKGQPGELGLPQPWRRLEAGWAVLRAAAVLLPSQLPVFLAAGPAAPHLCPLSCEDFLVARAREMGVQQAGSQWLAPWYSIPARVQGEPCMEALTFRRTCPWGEACIRVPPAGRTGTQVGATGSCFRFSDPKNHLRTLFS